MKILNFALFFPVAFATLVEKTVRLKLTDEIQEKIEEQGLYHITSNKRTAQAIMESGYIKASRSILNSYGLPAACMFLGMPDIDNYTKNLTNGAYDNILLHPEKVIHAVKIMPRKNELANYKLRVQDNVILHEGDCIIPQERVEQVQLVIDVKKTKDGKNQLYFRERTPEEKAKDTDIVTIQGKQVQVPWGPIPRYTPSNECLRAIQEEKQKKGYVDKDILNVANGVNLISHAIDTDKYNSTKVFFGGLAKHFGQRNSQKEIPENENAKVHRIIKEIESGQIETKTPVRSKKYTESILKFKKEDILQEKISELLPQMAGTANVQFLKTKKETINKSLIKNSKIHGINHNNRVALLAMAIIEKKGIELDGDTLDILVTAAYYHDIGRIFDVGPHAKRSSKLLENTELKYLNGEEYSKEDRDVLRAIVEGHEGKDKDVNKLIKKYNIPEDREFEMKFLLQTLKDADALDRARLSSKGNMDLNPIYLRTKEAKSLVNFSFQLETLTNKVPDFDSILSYDDEFERRKENKFKDSIKDIGLSNPEEKYEEPRKTEVQTEKTPKSSITEKDIID